MDSGRREGLCDAGVQAEGQAVPGAVSDDRSADRARWQVLVHRARIAPPGYRIQARQALTRHVERMLRDGA